MSIRHHQRRPSKWATIPEPSPGARYRGYLRYSEKDAKDRRDDQTTFLMQKAEIDAYAKARGWVWAGWDEEPAVTGAAEEIALRPAFQKHLDDAAAGRFEVSLCHVSDRWARDTEIAVGSLKRLRRAGVYWATADGKWDVNKVIADGHSVA
jgi:DNA invertase Pin-like site-specific DNA recombinase